MLPNRRVPQGRNTIFDRRRLPDQHRNIERWPQWTPDDSAIAHVAGSPPNVWAAPLDGGPPHQLTRFSDGRRIGLFAWSRDGKRLALTRTTTTHDIVMITGLKQ